MERTFSLFLPSPSFSPLPRTLTRELSYSKAQNARSAINLDSGVRELRLRGCTSRLNDLNDADPRSNHITSNLIWMLHILHGGYRS